ncbi:unnamed protein product [Miscanthus lutarioriparius]|uniref:Uncharacterized protein n=1 Tax=Miscanthus lutarioriparius TaxID=422564 RepID=A0A811PKF6_9POAL|nr:unnamed protein product [Miscanthus lutarioriparius]
MAGRFVFQELASGVSRSTSRLSAKDLLRLRPPLRSSPLRKMAPEPSPMSSLQSILARRFPAVAVGFMAVNLFHGAAVRPGMVVPSNREILSGSEDGIRTLINVFHGAAIHPGTAFPSSSRGLHGPAARFTARSTNGMPSSITNHKDLLHEQNMKIIKLQNEFEITKAEMEVLRANIKTEVIKGQTTVLKYCIIILGAGVVGRLLWLSGLLLNCDEESERELGWLVESYLLQ